MVRHIDVRRHLAGQAHTAPPAWANAPMGLVNDHVVLHAGGGELEGAWHRQDSDEVLIVLSGQATVESDSGPTVASPGECVVIAAHERHRVTCAEGTVLVAIEGSAARRYQ